MTMKRDLLVLLSQQWLTPISALEKAGCFSLSQRIGELKREGVPIESKWMPLGNGKRVMSYRVKEAAA